MRRWRAGSTTATAVDNGSNDACGIQSLALSQTAFVCSDVGANTELLTVTDVNGNTTTCTTTVTVEDNNGTQEIATPPASVVATDNRTFQTLSDWGIELSAAAVSRTNETGSAPRACATCRKCSIGCISKTLPPTCYGLC